MSTLEYEWGSTHYANRRTRAARHIRGCRRKVADWPKADPTCGGAFVCANCKRLVGWCTGGHEGSPRDEWCADCWVKDDRQRERNGVDYDDHLARLRRKERSRTNAPRVK